MGKWCEMTQFAADVTDESVDSEGSLSAFDNALFETFVEGRVF